MRASHALIYLMLLIFIACSRDAQEPANKCGIPSTENYVIGEIDAECVLAEEGEEWSNFPGTVSRLNCLQILKSELISYTRNMNYSIIISIPHSEGQDCEALSPNAIQTGRYNLVNGNAITGPGDAGFSVSTSSALYASWFMSQDQDPEAYFEITSVEDISPLPGWNTATYYKRVKGKVNCKLKDPDSSDPPIEIRDLEFSLQLIY